MTIPTDRLSEIAGDPFTACIDCETLGALAAELLACREEREKHITAMAAIAQRHLDAVAERDAARAEVEQARRDGQEQTAGLHEKLAEVRAEAEKLRIESQANADSLGDWRRKAEFLLQEREQGIAARETLDDVCKALCADIDSAVAQALMFKEKAGELAAVQRPRDELVAAVLPVLDKIEPKPSPFQPLLLALVAAVKAAEQPKPQQPEGGA